MVKMIKRRQYRKSNRKSRFSNKLKKTYRRSRRRSLKKLKKRSQKGGYIELGSCSGIHEAVQSTKNRGWAPWESNLPKTPLERNFVKSLYNRAQCLPLLSKIKPFTNPNMPVNQFVPSS